MTDRTFRARLEELTRSIDGLCTESGERLLAMVAETNDRHDRMRRAMRQLAGDLGSLSLATKYLAFDLEATRRENRQLRMARGR